MASYRFWAIILPTFEGLGSLKSARLALGDSLRFGFCPWIYRLEDRPTGGFYGALWLARARVFMNKGGSIKRISKVSIRFRPEL